MRQGHCLTCHRLRDLTSAHLCRSCVGQASGGHSHDEPTEAELDAMIAEQRPTMPDKIGREPATPRRPAKMAKRSRGENVS